MQKGATAPFLLFGLERLELAARIRALTLRSLLVADFAGGL